MFSASEIFDVAIRIEENGERFYRQAREGTANEDLRMLLDWLAKEEVEHKERFAKMKASIKHRKGERWAEQISGAILQSAMEERAFSLNDVDFGAIENEQELLQVALGLEEDSITFYEIMESFVTDTETVRHVKEIIQEEEKHIRAIKERLATLEQALTSA